MRRKNVKSAPPSTNGGMSSRTMYRSRTSNLTALLYHSGVYRPSEHLLMAVRIFVVLAGVGDAAPGASGVPDRHDRFQQLALTRQSRAATGDEPTADAHRRVYATLV